MKNKLIVSSLALLSSLLLSSCGATPIDYDVKAYEKTLEYKDNFKIMQLTDIHISLPTDMKKQFDFLENNIKTCNPDLIAITGDSFFWSDKKTS